MNELDYGVLAILLVSLLIGIWRGAIREVVNIAGWVIAFFVAQAYAPDLKDHLSEWMADPAVKTIVAWLVIFLAVMVSVSVIGSLIAEGVRKLGLGFLDRGLGAVVGLARGALIAVLLALAAGLTTFPRTPMWKGAAFTPWLETMALYVRTWLPDNLAGRIVFDRARSDQRRAGMAS